MGSQYEMDMAGLTLVCKDVRINETQPGGTSGTSLSATELGALDTVVAGTVTASKALVVDSSKNLSTLGTVTMAKLITSAGTATVAPIVLTTGTNLTTAAVGAIEFDGDAFYATSQASSRATIPAQQYIIQATEPAADNNTGLDTAVAAAVFTANTGAITLVSGKNYMFEGAYNLTNTGTTSHTWATAFGGTATFTATGTGYSVQGSSGVTAGTPIAPLLGFLTGATMSTAVVCTAASTSATEQVTVKVWGTFVVNAGGTLIPQMKASARPGASGTPGVVHKAGSYFRIWQVPTLGAVGNWS